MRILFISGELIAGDLPYRLSEEGCDVKLSIENPGLQDCQSGFVQKIDDWRGELDWIGKSGLIVFDDVGFGAIQDQLRRDGFRVFGGSAGGDRLELDREFAQQVFADLGLEVLPTLRFEHPADAAQHIRTAAPHRWVVKQNNHDSALCYVGELDDGSDAIGVLESYQQCGIRDITLQQAADGVELGVARYFNGRDWVGPVELSVEHKALCDGDIGPKTGEMGSLAWYSDETDQPLFEKVLAPLKPYLIESGYRGDIAVNCIVNGQRAVPLEFTARLGCPITHIQSALHLTPWRELLGAIADGRPIELDYRRGYGIGLTVGGRHSPIKVKWRIVIRLRVFRCVSGKSRRRMNGGAITISNRCAEKSGLTGGNTFRSRMGWGAPRSSPESATQWPPRGRMFMRPPETCASQK